MNITIKQTIDDALYILGVNSDNLTPQNTAYSRAFRTLQSYLATLSEENLDIFTNSPFNSLDDVLPVKMQAYLFIYSNLAINIAPLFSIGPMDAAYQSAMLVATESEIDMRALYSETPKSVFPSNLPVGSGNSYDNSSHWDSFYPDLDEQIYKDECCGHDNEIFSNKGTH